jgi:hypothetical protein
MIDTIRGVIAIPWDQKKLEKLEKEANSLTSSWRLTKRTMSDGTGDSESWTLNHKSNGMYITGNAEGARIIQCSLPRLVFRDRDNTNLIKNEQDLATGFDKMRLQMLEVLEYETLPRWTRIDLVWNFLGKIEEYIACFRSTRHPSVRKPTRIFDGESISWKGKATEIQIYDKIKEKKEKAKQYANLPVTIVRVEIRKSIPRHGEKFDLTTELCNPVMGGYLPDFEKCYQYYRRQLCLLSPKSIPAVSSRSPIDFLAYLQANGICNSQGTPLIDIYLANKSKSSKYRTMSMIKDRVVRHKFINWHHILPEKSTPKPVDYNDLRNYA